MKYYANKKNIDLGKISKEKIYSRDRNIWHISHEGGELEDLANRPKESMFVALEEFAPYG